MAARTHNDVRREFGDSSIYSFRVADIQLYTFARCVNFAR